MVCIIRGINSQVIAAINLDYRIPEHFKNCAHNFLCLGAFNINFFIIVLRRIKTYSLLMADVYDYFFSAVTFIQSSLFFVRLYLFSYYIYKFYIIKILVRCQHPTVEHSTVVEHNQSRGRIIIQLR